MTKVCKCKNCKCKEKPAVSGFDGWRVALALASMGYNGPHGILAPTRHITNEDILTPDVINRQIAKQ